MSGWLYYSRYNHKSLNSQYISFNVDKNSAVRISSPFCPTVPTARIQRMTLPFGLFTYANKTHGETSASSYSLPARRRECTIVRYRAYKLDCAAGPARDAVPSYRILQIISAPSFIEKCKEIKKKIKISAREGARSVDRSRTRAAGACTFHEWNVPSLRETRFISHNRATSSCHAARLSRAANFPDRQWKHTFSTDGILLPDYRR